MVCQPTNSKSKWIAKKFLHSSYSNTVTDSSNIVLLAIYLKIFFSPCLNCTPSHKSQPYIIKINKLPLNLNNGPTFHHFYFSQIFIKKIFLNLYLLSYIYPIHNSFIFFYTILMNL